jgi:hypothetical protein
LTKPVITLLDIETAPLGAHVWGLWDQTVGLNQIAQEWSILSYCGLPLDGRKKDMEYRDNRDAKDPRDDSMLLEALWLILDESDFIIAQNGKKFDSRKIQARLIAAGYPPPRPYQVIDTMLMAKEVAAFTSNKQEWLTKHLTSGNSKDSHKAFPGFELWRECLAGNPLAWKAMEKYNRQDVWSMRDLYLRLRPWAKTHPNVAIFAESDKPACPRCGDDRQFKQDGFLYTNAGKYERMHCGHCGGWSKGRYTRNTKEVRKAQYGSV